MSKRKVDPNENRWVFMVYADSPEEAEEIRQYVEEKLDASHFPKWDVDGEIDDLGPQGDEDE